MPTQIDPLEELSKAEETLLQSAQMREAAEYLLGEARAGGNPQGAAAAKAALQRANDDEMRVKASMPKLMELAKAQQEYRATKQDSLGKLASGEFRVSSPQSTSFSMGELPTQTQFTQTAPTRSNAALLIADALDVPLEKVDMNNGLTAGDRAILQAIPTDEERIAALKGKYGENNVSILNIDGKTTPVVRKEDGTVVLSDEIGESIADLVDFGVGVGIEAPKIIAAGLTSIATAPSVVGSAVAGSASYSGVGAAQDELVRAALGMDARPLETAQRRGMEAALGAAIEIPLMGTGKFLASRVGKPVRNEILDELSKASTTMNRAGYSVEFPAAAAMGERALATAQDVAGRYPEGSLANRMKRSQEAIVSFMQSMVNRQPSREGYENLVKGLKAETEQLASLIAGKDIKSQKILEGFVGRRQQDAMMARQDKEKVGQMLRETLEDAKQVETNLQSNAYQGIYSEADKAGFQVRPEEIANYIRRKQLETRGMSLETKEAEEIIQMLYASDKSLAQSNALKQMVASGQLPADEKTLLEIQRLEKNAAPKGLSDLHEMRQQFSDKIADGGASGAGVKSNSAKKLTAYMNEFMDERLRSFDPQLADKWAATNADFDNKLAFGRGAVGRILRQKLGDSAATPEAMARIAIESKTNAMDILATLQRYDQEAGTSVASEVRGYLQSAYLDKIGLTTQKGVSPKQVSLDREIMDALFGDGSTGSGKIYADKLDRLNMAITDAKINPKSIRKEQVSQLFSSLDQQTERAVIKQIVAKEIATDAQERLLSSRIVQVAKSGGWQKIPTDKMAEAVLHDSTRVSEVGKILRKTTDKEREQLKQDAIQSFFEKYSNGDRVQASSSTQLWDASRFLADLKTSEGRRFEQKMRTIIGSETFDKLHAASVMIEANKIPVRTPKGNIRTTASLDKDIGINVNSYLADSLPDKIRAKFLSFAYGQKMLDPILEGLALNVGEAETQRRVGKTFSRIITTSKGLQTMAMEATKDPEFAIDVADYMNRVAEIEEKYSQN